METLQGISKDIALLPFVSCCLLAPLWSVSRAAEAPKPYHAPRSADGHADMEGNWKNSNLTPLERPAEFSTLVITPADADKLRAQYLAPAFNPNQPDDPGRVLENRVVEPIRGELRSSLIIDPADGKIPWNAVYQEKSAEMRKKAMTVFDNPEDRTPIERCLNSNGVAPMIPNNDDNLYEFVQTHAITVIVSESVHDARMIRMNSTHSPAEVTSWLGDSIAWWEGETLVVETKYFAPHSAVRANGRTFFLVSPDTTVVERFTRVSEVELNYVFTVSDPNYYSRPWTGESHLSRTKDRLFEYACHEGNYSMRNIFEGARQSDLNGSPPH